MAVEENKANMKKASGKRASATQPKGSTANGNSSVYSTNWAKLSDIMHKNVVATGPDENVVEAAKKMSDRSISCMVITEQDNITGIVTETDFIRKVLPQHEKYKELSVGRIMTSPVVTLCQSVPLVEASQIMEENNVKRLPVTRDGKLVGIVTQTDLIQAMTTHIYCDISEIMSENIASVKTGSTVAQAAEKMASDKISCLVVKDKERVTGVITERDIVKKVVAVEKDPSGMAVEEIMSSTIVSVPSDYSAFSTGKVMESKGVRRVLVIDGDKLRGIVTQTDIFRAAKQMLDEQRKHSIMQSESSQNAICDIRADYVVTYANPALIHLLGAENQDQIAGKQFLPVQFWANPKDSEKFLNELKTGEIELKELQFKSTTGKKLFVTAFVTYTKNAQGQTENIRIVIYDITAKKQLAEQKRLEQDLKESEERFHNLMEHTPGVLQGYGTDGKIFYWNRASEKIFGYSAEEAVGRKITDLIVPDDLKEEFEDKLKAGAQAKESGQFVPQGEMTLKNRKGEPVPVHSIHTLVNIEGKEPLLFRIDVDLSERKEIERQLKAAIAKAEKAQSALEVANKKLEATANEANSLAQEAMVSDLSKSQFLASMSHEIRTPLNAIIGLSEVLTEEELNDEQKNYLGMIRESAQNMLVLINDILDFSKIQAGSFDLNVTESSVEHLLAVIESLMRPQTIERDLEFRVYQVTDLPTMIQTDTMRVRQCILNLINFAISSTETGHIYVNVALEENNGQDFIRFDIEDTSDGISKEDIEKIFDRFTPSALLNNASSNVNLGLAVTRKIANLLGGDVSVKSRQGNGNKFSLLIPTGVDVKTQATFNKYDRMEKIRTVSAKEKGADDKFYGKALVAEDTPTNQTLIQLLLERLGLDVTIAEDGMQAVERAQAESFDIILMDIQMPNMNGYDATKKLRQEGFDKPIIAVTAHAMKGDREKCLKAGCDDYISKPIDRNELVKVLRLHLPIGQEPLSAEVEQVNSQVEELSDMCEQADERIEKNIRQLSDDSQSPVDWEAVTEMCDDEEVVCQVVEMFLNDSPRCIGSLAEAIKDANPKLIRMYAHSLKGASSQIGAKKLADVAYQLECAGRDKKFDNVPELFNQIQDEYGKISVFLSQPDWMQQAKQQHAHTA
ncbi:MAG: CBS domain-containing protein [Sedimentisphaerales bacterium]|nr:CBS domain-containing protein [Sedimentisphaerales bacterium]